MTDAEIIQLADKLVRAMPMVRDLEALRDAICKRLAIAEQPKPKVPFDKVAYQRTYMRQWRLRRARNKERANSEPNPFL